jgi:hypothetical protein
MSTQTKDDPLLRIDPTYTGPNYQGFHFTLVSGSGKPTHTLTIITQASELLTETASITGDWKGDGAAKSITGLITDNGGGIDCGWTTPNGKNVLQGTLTYSS